jgi:hypothetical protein
MLRKMEKPAVTPVHPILPTSYNLTTLLLGNTNGPATAAGGLGVLTTHTEAPVVTETTVSTDLLETLQILTELGVDTVGQDLRVLAVDNVALSVEEPGGDLVLGRVLDDGDNSLQLFGGELTSAAGNHLANPFSSLQCFLGIVCIPLVQVNIGLLADQVGVTTTDTLDLGQGVHDLLLAIDVGVQKTQDLFPQVVSQKFSDSFKSTTRCAGAPWRQRCGWRRASCARVEGLTYELEVRLLS